MKRASVLVVLGLLLLATATAVLAGGWAVVTLDSPPGEIHAGEPWTVGFTVLQHGQTPVHNLGPGNPVEPLLIATNADGRRVEAASTSPSREPLIEFPERRGQDVDKLGRRADPQRDVRPSPRPPKMPLVSRDQIIRPELDRRDEHREVFILDHAAIGCEFPLHRQRDDLDVHPGHEIAKSRKDCGKLSGDDPLDFLEIVLTGGCPQHRQVMAQQVEEEPRRGPVRDEAGEDDVGVQEHPNFSFCHTFPGTTRLSPVSNPQE